MRSVMRAAALALVVVGLSAAMHLVSAMPPPPGDDVAPALVVAPAEPAPTGSAGGTPVPTARSAPGPSSPAPGDGAGSAGEQAPEDEPGILSPTVPAAGGSPTGPARPVDPSHGDPSHGASTPTDGEHGEGWDVATVPVPPVAPLPWDGDHFATTTPTPEGP